MSVERNSCPKTCKMMMLRLTILLLFAVSVGFCQSRPSIYVHLNGKDTTTKLQIISSTLDSANVRVTGKNGLSIKGLGENDFVIVSSSDTADLISCQEMTSETTSDLAISLIFDNSGSMFSAYDSLTMYADRFIDSLSDGFIANAITFDDVERKPSFELSRRGTMYIALTGFSSEREVLKDFWHYYDTVRSKYSPLNDAMLAAIEQIRYRRQKSKDERKDVVILVTDGADNASKTTLSTLQELIEALKVTLFTISYSNEPNNKLDWLARKTGGKHFNSYYLHDLRNLLDGIRRNISSSYKLTYRFPFRGASTPK
jgi:hypothetical protein